MRLASGVTTLVVAFLLIYLPDVGHGFIKDDFAWIRTSRSADVGQLFALFTANTGFYRPLVSVSFAADHALWGLNPPGYGFTNLALFGACAVLLFALARGLGLSPPAAVLGTAVWAFNFHAVNMALLWLSGRTSLLVTLFSISTARVLLRGSHLFAGLFSLGAMLAKEEAALLPALFTVFFFLDQPSAKVTTRLRHGLALCWPLWLSLLIYAALRLQSGAFGPLDAPSYYQFSFSPGLILRNVAEYADRAATAGVVVALVLFFAVGPRRPRLVEHELRTLLLAGIWVVATYALTVLLPVRSSLYALLPSVGIGLAAGAFGSWAARTSPARFQNAATALVILTVLLVPVYRSRNIRWVALADLSARVMRAVRAEATRQPNGGRIVLVDSPNERFNLDSTFGTLFPDAVSLIAGPLWTGRVLSPGEEIPVNTTVSFRLANGRLIRGAVQ